MKDDALQPVQEDGVQNSGESISCYSLTDSEVVSYNHRIINCDNYDMSRRMWESISNLGVKGKDEIGMSVKLVEALERRDKVRLVGKKEIKNQS